MKTLINEQRVRLEGWTCETTTIHFLQGEQLERAIKHGHHIAFTVFAGHCISANPEFYNRDKQRHAEAAVVRDGETIRSADGRKWVLKVMDRNSDMPRNSDPIHVIPVRE